MTYGIFPEDLAEHLKSRAGEKYRPGNGTEGDCFFAAWCRQCARDKAMSEGADFDECDDNERCDIIADTMRFNLEDQDYPGEWRIGKDGQPCCTAFIPSGSQIPEARCPYTQELF